MAFVAFIHSDRTPEPANLFQAIGTYTEEVPERPGSPCICDEGSGFWVAFKCPRCGKTLVMNGKVLATAKATIVRVRDGMTIKSEETAADTEERLGGFFIFDCPELDEACRWASKVVDAATGSVELRPILEASTDRSKS